MTSTERRKKIVAFLPPCHAWGQKIICLESVDSTNTYAKRLAADGAPHGTVVLADAQSAGRGRMGRNFSSPAGKGLYLSVILRPDCSPEALMHLTCAVGVAAAEAIEKVCDRNVQIKWINDLIVGKRKLGGILTELRVDPATRAVDYAVVGIGINCLQTAADFPEDVRPIATSLSLCGAQIDREALAAALIDELFRMDRILQSEKAQIMAQFCARCVTLGQQISFSREGKIFHGRAVSVDEEGALSVELSDGTRETIAAGEVSIRGMYGYL